jgi:hypothetical protein
MTGFMKGFPCNANGEIVVKAGVGDDVVVGYLPSGFHPLDEVTKGLPLRLPDAPADRTAAIAMSTTANAVLILPIKITERDGITYDTATGVVTFTKAGIYSHNMFLNVVAPANRIIFACAEIWNGTAWAKSQYSARQTGVTTTTDGQIMFASNNYFPAGTQLRFTLWASGACQLATEDIPGVPAGTQTTPAIRLLYTGNVSDY